MSGKKYYDKEQEASVEEFDMGDYNAVADNDTEVNALQQCPPVSYTHLDVYKRQPYLL